MTDNFTVRAVVIFLGITTLVGLIGLIWLVGTTDVEDAALLAIIAGPTGTALGALGTLLANSRTSPERVVVANAPSEPVPVDAADEQEG